MANSLTEIANSALIKVGAARIISLDDDTKEAQVCKEQLPKLRDEVMRSHPWNFAIDFFEIAAEPTPPISEWDFQSIKPANSLRILEVNDGSVSTANFTPQATDFKFQIQGQKILHNFSPAFIRFIFRETIVANWDANFSEVLAFRLAADIAYSLAQSRTLATELMDEYKKVIATARSYDAQEGSVRHVVAGTWINSRN